MVIVASLALGPWLATLPYGENDPCFGYKTEGDDGGGTSEAVSWWPAGHVCHVSPPNHGQDFNVLHRPSVLATLVVTLLTGLLLALAIHRRSPATRGAVLAITVLALFSFLYHVVAGDFAPAVFLTVVYCAPITFAADWFLRPCGSRSLVSSTLTLVFVPLIVIVAWFVPYAFLTDQTATPVGVAAGTLALVAGRRLQPTFQDWFGPA